MTDPRTILGPMADSLERTTGRTVDDWVAIARGAGARAGEIRERLKSEHGLTHGYANALALIATGYGQAGDAELVEGLFAGPKAGLRPIYDRLLEIVGDLGDDVTVAPKKSMVSFRRTKQFACLTPMSGKRADLGVNLRAALGDEAAGVARLKPTPGGMASHVFAVATAEEIDDEVVGWIRRAYEVN
jgi:predicted transport protein